MDLNELQWHWNEFGKTDPLFAILTVPSKRNNGWKPDEFFRTGLAEIESAIGYLNSLGRPLHFERALDFGCGVGRLTQALCSHFQTCDGVDIAPSMLEAAGKFNKYSDRCRYHLNEAADLRLFPDNSFDLVYSMIVLQHMESRFVAKYVEEFLRVIKPGGVALFQIPSGPAKDNSEPLADEAFSAFISADNLPASLPSGSRSILTAKVKNTSSATWPSWKGINVKFPIKLGNHWLTREGTPHRWDDGRAWLTADLGPGQETQFELAVSAPASPGEYILELDMVQEHVGWFAQKASGTLRTQVSVTQNPDSSILRPNLNPPAKTPRMEMHCVPREQIIRIVTLAGGAILDTREDSMAAGYEGYQYCVTK